MTRLFIYGTLKKGGSNHRYLKGQIFLADAQSAPGFRLYDLGDFPGMVRDRTALHAIDGELWEVDSGCLARLDELEGIAEGLYRREVVALTGEFARTRAETYLYARDITGRKDVGTSW